MKLSTANLSLSPDAAIDLQVHTLLSDGTWTPEALLDHLVDEQFGLAAITDHDRVDTQATLQRLALEKKLPVVVAVEMTTTWRGEMTDVLCFGFDPENNALNALAQDVLRRHQENTRQAYEILRHKGYLRDAGAAEAEQAGEIRAILDKPSAQQPNELVAFLMKHIAENGDVSPGKMLGEAGVTFATSDITVVVEAAHRSGAVCLIAHPGRGDGFPRFDGALLDQLRQDVPIDGFEVYYPLHTDEQTAMFLAYAEKHDLLTSAGSDSHGPNKKPIKYRADLSRKLLERLGIAITR